MAIMYPKNGPVKNDSYIAEPTVYKALATQLSDEFIVIHSIPWLAQVAKEIDGRNVPTGEIDFDKPAASHVFFKAWYGGFLRGFSHKPVGCVRIR
jgi:hypothetical protein